MQGEHVQNDNVESRELVALIGTDSPIATIMRRHGRTILTTLPETEPSLAAKLHKAMTGDRLNLQDIVGSEIEVQHIIIHRRLVPARDGKPAQQLTEIVLIAPNGEMYATCSPFVASALSDWATIVGDPPWSPAAKFVVSQRTTAQKRTMLYLTAVS